MRILCSTTALLVLLFASGCASTPSAPAEPPTPLVPGTSSALRVEQLAWMSGVWICDKGALHVEEYWTPPGGGLLLGAGRELDGKKLTFFEHLRIEEREGTLYYVAIPRGRGVTDFALTLMKEHEVVFENPAHEFPRLIRYRLEQDGTLVARIEGGGKSDEWRYRRSN